MEITKEILLEKVRELYLKYGIRSVTMNDVARELGISKKTLYVHFEDKKDLVTKIVFSEFDKIKEQIKNISKQNKNAIEISLEISRFIVNMRTTYSPTLEYDLKKYYPEISKKVHDTQRKKMYKSIIENQKKGIKEGLFRKDLIPEIIANIQVTRMELITESDFKEMKQYTIKQILSEVFKYHLYGICSQKGLDYLKKMKNYE